MDYRFDFSLFHSKDNVKKWYVLHVLSGKEDNVKDLIEKKISKERLGRFFGRILLPEEDVVEVKDGIREQSKRKFYPGYIILEMAMNYKSWFLVRHTPQVISFISAASGIPVPVSFREISLVIDKMKETDEGKPNPKIFFRLGEIIRVVDGPFSNFNGTIEDINYEKSKLCVGVVIFGRSTPIDFNFNQVEKV